MAARRLSMIDLTPLIDVVFLLVVFFMMTSNFVRTESLELAIPDNRARNADAAAQPAAVPPAAVLVVDRSGIVREEGNVYGHYTDPGFVAFVQALVAVIREAGNDRGIVLRVHPDVTVETVVAIMDRIYLSGGRKLTVATWQEPQRAQIAPPDWSALSPAAGSPAENRGVSP